MNKDKKRANILMEKFSPKMLRLAVCFISFDGTVQKLGDYLRKHKDFHPDQRELFQILMKLDDSEIVELESLSHNIAMRGYDIDEIIPLNNQ